MWEIDLSDNTALVTGASRGIGRAIAFELAKAGADVIAVARTESDLTRLRAEIEGLGRHCLTIVDDLGTEGASERVTSTAWSWKTGVDILVNAAGIIIRKDPPDVTLEDFDQVMAVNLRAPFLLTQALGWKMKQGGGGSIVNIASVAGEEVTGASLTYQVSKAALIHLTRGFAARLAPEVRVNAVGPGYIRTSLNEAWLNDPENARYVEERTALGRIGTPEDVVGAVIYLASSAAAYVSGHHLRVDGGWGV